MVSGMQFVGVCMVFQLVNNDVYTVSSKVMTVVMFDGAASEYVF